MTNDLAVKSENGTGQEHQIDDATMLRLISTGDLTGLNDKQRSAVYRARCESAGLDYRAQPFQIIKMKGKDSNGNYVEKEVLYALKAATDQLAAKHGVRCEVISQVTENGIRTVTVRAIAKDGRQTDEIGCVTVQGLAGDMLANAYMKAVTKAKRRAVLSICGLGMLDETEIETIPNTNAPPPLPLPRRRSEAPVDPPRVVEVEGPAPEPTAEEINAKLERAAMEDAGGVPVATKPKLTGRLITDKQVNRLFAIARAGGKGEHIIHKYIAHHYGIESAKEVTGDIYDSVCTWAAKADAGFEDRP